MRKMREEEKDKSSLPVKEEKTKSNVVCNFSREGSCKYGISGKNCKFTHSLQQICPTQYQTTSWM